MSTSDDAAVINVDAVTNADNGKCQVRGCRVAGAQRLVCAADGCNKTVHLMCYQGVVLRDKSGGDLRPLSENHVVCTKACYNNFVKSLSGSDSSRGKWTNDGKGGPDDQHTSMRILLDWMTTEGNYSRYCGKGNNGVTKLQFASTLAEKMRAETKSDTRNGKQVLDKIARIENAFRDAASFARSETGAGIQEGEGEQTFQAAVRRRCPYYYELVEIMGDRSSTHPKCTTTVMGPYRDENVSSPTPTNGSPSSLNDGSSSDEQNSPEQADQRTPGESEGGNKVSEKPRSIPSIKGRKRSKRKHAMLQFDEISVLQKADERSDVKIQEAARHNRRVEQFNQQKLEQDQLRLEQEKFFRQEALNLEKRKLDLEANSWKGKFDMLQYKSQLVTEYHKMKSQGMSEKQIVAVFPEMEPIIAAFKVDDGSDADD
ncbi:hypothetical protein IV203_020185 [Nitzschia inconspicua]|uniref:Uncharacterized protein n=1 Tax=Nitzschia inconspicua TaxID=303405 RepID=A0A9K3K5B9_9STRA|nr:hypothetical protein IV203_022793 [Nitzschia inconspicua]KAG7339864.1 hypothetical protein IV203_024914 [Nitzschia inconspicua]KAG7342337.1 hypothetical protein IV203_007430 [Nitzschia inconspicua]KAG7348573.1 hypothetical protein IV203_017278 [Nitzschia inconspicua]KAG7351199.1 hypothetical protein IV203_010559 [Nitzschia inconspicua]